MNLSRILITAGVILVVLGVAVWIGARLPGLQKLGRLPGDIRIQRDGFGFYFPLASSLLLSALLTLIAYLWRRFKG